MSSGHSRLTPLDDERFYLVRSGVRWTADDAK